MFSSEAGLLWHVLQTLLVPLLHLRLRYPDCGTERSTFGTGICFRSYISSQPLWRGRKFLVSLAAEDHWRTSIRSVVSMLLLILRQVIDLILQGCAM